MFITLIFSLAAGFVVGVILGKIYNLTEKFPFKYLKLK
jgi:hypothetical protein